MKKISWVFLIVCSIFLWGCTGVEPEKRAYPQVIGVDWQQEVYQVMFAMPNLQEATGQDKSGAGENASVLGFRGKNVDEIENSYEQSQEKYLDVGHVQVLVLGHGILQSQRWEELLATMKENPMLGEDIYVFQAEDISQVMKYNGTQGNSLGDYLVGIYENRPYGKSTSGITLRQVYKTWYDSGQLPALPQVAINSEGYPQIE